MQGRNSWGGGEGGFSFVRQKNVIQQKIRKILLKNAKIVQISISPPQHFWEKKYSLATEMSVWHELCYTLLVRQNKLTPLPVVIPRLRPCNHDDLLGTIWKSRFNSSGEEGSFL